MNRIEKSKFRPGEYVGYAHGVWHIKKTNSSYGNWIARKDDSPNETIYAMKLSDMDRKLGEWEAAHPRSHNPGRKKVHTAKWDRCVKDVRKKGTAVDPYAVCTAAMGELAIRKPYRRAANPLPKLTSVRKIYYAVTARKGHETLYLKRNGKLTRKASDAARFQTVKEAEGRARAHLHRYPVSRSYRFSVGLAY